MVYILLVMAGVAAVFAIITLILGKVKKEKNTKENLYLFAFGGTYSTVMALLGFIFAKLCLNM